MHAVAGVHTEPTLCPGCEEDIVTARAELKQDTTLIKQDPEWVVSWESLVHVDTALVLFIDIAMCQEGEKDRATEESHSF